MTDPTALDSTSIFDHEAALERLCGSVKTLRKAAQIFLAQGPQLISDIRGAAASEDFEILERSAHTLKGSAGVLGANEVARLAQRVETNARERNLPRSVESLDELDRAVRAVIGVLHGFVAVSAEDSKATEPACSR